jgi:hypothetical protein
MEMSENKSAFESKKKKNRKNSTKKIIEPEIENLSEENAVHYQESCNNLLHNKRNWQCTPRAKAI